MREDTRVVIRRASSTDHEAVTSMALRLLSELYDPREWGYSLETLEPAVKSLLQEGTGYWALLAYLERGAAVGFVGLNQCSAVYAFGQFGEISELYVDPEHRTAGIGAALMDAAVRFGRERGWSLLEVGAPAVPRWQRTVDFYLRGGFSVVGPRLTLSLSTPNNALQRSHSRVTARARRAHGPRHAARR